MKNLYEILGINNNCDEKDISKAWKKLSFKYHPDKNKTEEAKSKLSEINKAYEILKDKEKRRKYDTFGYSVFDDNFNHNNTDPSNIFNMFDINSFPNMMNNVNSFFNNININNVNNIIHKIVDVTLDEMRIGTKKIIHIKTNCKCNKCNGRGYLSNGRKFCETCRGKKFLYQRMYYNGGYSKDIKIKCNTCNSKGFIIKEGFECKECECTGLIEENKKYKLNINKGNIDGKDLIIKNKGNYNPELDTRGDIHIKLKEIEHNNFKRINNNLYTKINISLGKALCGCIYKLNYLNNEKLYINIDKIINPNYIMKIKDYGMPIINDNNILYGDLLIHFNIIFPDKLSKEIKNDLKSIFNIEDNNYNDDTDINLTNIEYHKEVCDMEKEEEEYSNVQCTQQ